MELQEKKHMENVVIDALKSVYDPEIPVDIYELGLIYEIKISPEKHITIIMTLTSPSCPVAESLPVEVEEKIKGIEGVTQDDRQER